MERDYPVGHPASSDYKGHAYIPPQAPYGADFPKGHPARGGANVSALDTVDGMRTAATARAQSLQELAAVGSLPPLKDDLTGEAIPLTPQELAYIYAVRKGLSDALASEVTAKYQLAPLQRATEVAEQSTFSAAEQAVMILIKRGYTPERAKELIDKYGVPEILADHEADAHK